MGRAVAAAEQHVEEHRHRGGAVQCHPHRVACPAHPGASVVFREARNLGDLAVAELVDEAQRERLAVAVGQRGQRLLQVGGVVIETQLVLDAGRAMREHRVVEDPRSLGGVARAAVGIVDAHVGQDAVQPWAQPAVVGQPAEVAVCTQERLLHGIFGGGFVDGAAASGGQQTGPVLANELFERLAIAGLQRADHTEFID